MTEIFSNNASLGGLLDSNEPLEVSDVIHKAFIEVTEKGTEAGKFLASTLSHMALSLNRSYLFPFQVEPQVTLHLLYSNVKTSLFIQFICFLSSSF